MLWRDITVRSESHPTASAFDPALDAPFEEVERACADTAHALPWDGCGQIWIIEPLIQCLLEPHHLFGPRTLTRLFRQGRPLFRLIPCGPLAAVPLGLPFSI